MVSSVFLFPVGASVTPAWPPRWHERRACLTARQARALKARSWNQHHYLKRDIPIRPKYPYISHHIKCGWIGFHKLNRIHYF